MKDQNLNKREIILRKSDILARYPDLIGRGNMHGFPDHAIYNLIIALGGIVPETYHSGNLDSNTCDVMMDLIGYVIDDHIGNTSGFSDIARADLELFCHELIEIAIDIRAAIPLKAHNLYFSGILGDYIAVKVVFDP